MVSLIRKRPIIPNSDSSEEQPPQKRPRPKSPTRPILDNQVHTSTQNSPTSSPPYPFETPDDPEETAYRISRIRDCINYTRTQHFSDNLPQAYTNFVLCVTTPPTLSLRLLREAIDDNLAFLVRYTPGKTEVINIGVRPALGGLGTYPDPNWWKGKTRAEIRAEGVLRGKKIGKMKRQARIEKKLVEGVRRQELGLPICDSDEGDKESEEGE